MIFYFILLINYTILYSTISYFSMCNVILYYIILITLIYVCVRVCYIHKMSTRFLNPDI